ncbi:MAG: LeuA family protein [Halolamina sp.]
MRLKDVTLREGDQLPGRSFSVEQKVAAGQALDRLGVEYIQAGFPVTGTTDREAITELAATTDAEVVGLARAVKGDIEAAVDAEADVVEIIASLSDDHLEHVVGMSAEEMFDRLTDAVVLARDCGLTPHVSVVDAFRTDERRLVGVFERCPDVPAVTLADTVGARVPSSVRSLLTDIGATVDLSRAGVHFHDDLGVATANALAAMDVGVSSVDVSVCSLGERAGNTALEALVVADATDGDGALSVATDELMPVCREVLSELDETIDPRRPVLGDAVTTHESGIHTAAMLDDPGVFEPFDPAAFGGRRRLLFGEGTGRGGARKLLARADVEPTDERVTTLLDALTEEGPVETEDAVALARRTFSGG